MPLPFLDVGKGFPVAVHCRQREPEEPHLSRGCEMTELADHITPTTIHHQVASPRTSVSCNAAFPTTSSPSRMRYYVTFLLLMFLRHY
jgi:hypothetical protein